MAKILLVEDDIDLSEQLRYWLTFHNHVVDWASSGPEALEQIQFILYDLIILDGHLPGFDGIEVCKRFRSSGGLTPVLVLSGGTERFERQAFRDAGANAYLSKPFSLDELSKQIASLLTKDGA